MLRWVWSYIRKYRLGIITGIFLSVLVSALNMIKPYIIGSIVDRVITGGEYNLLLPLLGIMIGAILLKAIFRFLYQMLFENASQSIIRNLRSDLYDHIQELDFSWYDKSPSGNVMTLLTSDLDAVRHFVAWVIYQTIENFLVYVFSIIVLSSINWKLTVAFLVIAPFIGFLVYRFKLQIKPAHLRVRDQFAVLNTRVGENIAGNRVVKAFVREDYETQRFDKENEEYRNRAIHNADVRIKFLPAIEAISGLLPVLLILLGGYLVITEEMTIGQLVTFNELMWAFTMPINMFGNLMNDYQRFIASAERLYELHCRTTTIKNPENPVNVDRVKGKVEFRNVSFAYNNTKVINNVSFTVNPGMTIGILGPTGSGKSTVAKLLCRFYDTTEGSVLVDDIDVKQYNLQKLRSNVGITMQEVFLFSDTVEGNIAFGVPDAPFADVEKAADLAHVTDFIKDLSDGYETIVGERGVGLSGGQKQRIALARLFLMNPPVMILDDTTSSVDNETEEKIRASIKKQSSGHTSFIISHRISSVQDADFILVFENGQLTEQGTHNELIQKDGYYRKVWMHQEGKNGTK